MLRVHLLYLLGATEGLQLLRLFQRSFLYKTLSADSCLDTDSMAEKSLILLWEKSAPEISMQTLADHNFVNTNR